MARPANQHDISVLSTSKYGMVFLTANDWTLIADKATRVEFKPGDTIIHRGKRNDGVHLILKGAAVVQIPGQVTAPTIGPGEVCGEISFLDEQPATLNVVAKDTVEAYYLDRATLQTLFEHLVVAGIGKRLGHAAEGTALSHRHEFERYRHSASERHLAARGFPAGDAVEVPSRMEPGAAWAGYKVFQWK